jgi:adenosylmethionine-8-amino-7-oxononanoate aminotransferase
MSASPPEDLDRLAALGAAHWWPPRQRAGLIGEAGVRLLVRGQGVWLEDSEGRKYIDLTSGTFNVNVGYGRAEIAEAIARQIAALSFVPHGAVAPPTLALAARIAAMMPEPGARVFFTSGGAEATETALKIARKYHLLRGEGTRYKIVSRRGSLHGGTLAAGSLGSSRGPGLGAHTDYGPPMPGALVGPGPNPSRCSACGPRGPCTQQCVKELERIIEQEGPSTVAAVISEPISLADGWHLPPPEYWAAVRQLCDRTGALLILDEVFTGLGRTGTVLALEHWGVQPDILLLAKGLGSGYVPIGAAVTTRRVADAFIGPDHAILDHAFTASGNPVACAAAMANLDILEREGLVQRSRELGRYLVERLQPLLRHPLVVDVRGGLGMVAVVELAKNTQGVSSTLRKHGLWGRGGRQITLAPPLCMTREEMDMLLERFSAAISELGPG